jgi:hypothetical protein
MAKKKLKLSRIAYKLLREYRESFSDFDRIGGFDPESWDEITDRYQYAASKLHHYLWQLEQLKTLEN